MTHGDEDGVRGVEEVVVSFPNVVERREEYHDHDDAGSDTSDILRSCHDCMESSCCGQTGKACDRVQDEHDCRTPHTYV